jgi:DNA invertase Pin-like site-specific DNA recombinase
MKQTVAIYARVSTSKQNHDAQLTELRGYCARRQWEEVEEIVDTACGAKSSREGLDRLMKAVRRGKVDVIVCYKLDRLGRSLAHLAAMIAEFAAHNVALVVPEQGIDTSSSNPAARLQLNVLGAVAEFEREIIRERVNDGIAAAKARGVRFGRPATLDAYREDITALREQGRSGRAIAAELSLPVGSVFQVIRESRLANLEKAA